jgi:hypothetical protein
MLNAILQPTHMFVLLCKKSAQKRVSAARHGCDAHDNLLTDVSMCARDQE